MTMIFSKKELGQAPPAVQPVLLSSLGHCLLQGIIFCQMVSYYQRRAADSLRLKLFVYIVFLLCLAQTVLEIYKVWTVTVSERDWRTDPARFIEFPLTSTICSAVQAFLVRRVWKFTGKRWVILVPLVILLLATFSAGLTVSVTVSKLIQAPLVNVTNCHGRRCVPEFSAWLWGSTILDATITVTLWVNLVKSKTQFHHLDAVLTKIWNLTLMTAAFPMASMLAAVSLFYATGGLHYHAVTALTIISSKLYFNGMLRNLNMREKLRASLQTNNLGRRSIVTIGSGGAQNNRRMLAETNGTSDDGLTTLEDTEKTTDRTYGCLNRGRVLTEPCIASFRRSKAEFDVERGDSTANIFPSCIRDDSVSYDRPKTWPPGQANRDRVVTL